MQNRNLQLTLAWILLASLIMGLALWQAQVVMEREAAAKHKNLPPPTDTRHAIRSTPTAPDIDHMTGYIARCEKGMTIQEIRWALTDFENAGLTDKHPDEQAPPAQKLAFRNKQARWHVQCLTEGLLLSRAQVAEAGETMGKLILEEHESHAKLLKKQAESTSKPDSIRAALLEDLDKNWRMPDIFHRVMPWELCKLTDSQQRVTWKQWYESTNHNYTSPTQGIDAILGRPEISDSGKLAEKTGGPVFLLSSPLNNALEEGDAADSIPDWMFVANRVLPLLATQQVSPEKMSSDLQPPRQDDPSSQSKLLRLIQRLHPAQFKTALLLKDGLAEAVRDELTKTGN